MKTLTLTRSGYAPRETLGVIYDAEYDTRYYTLEQPWRSNLTNASCIPEGEYVVRRIVSPKFGDCFAVENVKARTAILIHAGNTVEDTKGCILVGRKPGRLKGVPAVLESRAALRTLLQTRGDGFVLRIERDTGIENGASVNA